MNTENSKKINKAKVLGTVTILLSIVAIILAVNLYNKNISYATVVQNDSDKSLYEVVDKVQNTKIYLAKSLISKEANYSAKTLTHVWREANLAMCYLGMLPIESQEIENTEKFLNQVSEYSYALFNKNMNGQDLTEEDVTKIQELYNYSNDLSNTLTEMLEELNKGTLNWEDLKNNTEGSEISEVGDSNIIEQNFHEYTGLIYDGAYSEHITSSEKRGLTGDDISEEDAKKIAEEFIGVDKIKETKNNGFVENGNIPVYRFEIITNEDKTIGISISKKGGHVVFMNYDRDITGENITQQEAIQKGKEYLASKGFENMQETYSTKNNGFITVNYAYKQGNVIIYSDLIKVKIALDNGEIIGIETTGYLNCHYEREIPTNFITAEEASKNISQNVQMEVKGLAMIPTEFNTEVLCYEIKGKVNEIEFLTYVNAQTGKEQDTLILMNTENGVLTE